jgi:hypothetical protein
MEGPEAAPPWSLELVLAGLCRVVEALPEDMRSGSTPDGFPWELVTGGAIVGFFAFFLSLWRTVRSVRRQRLKKKSLP